MTILVHKREKRCQKEGKCGVGTFFKKKKKRALFFLIRRANDTEGKSLLCQYEEIWPTMGQGRYWKWG